MQHQIQVIDNHQVLTLSMQDILQYHGGLLPGGVAHAFQAMRAGFALLSDSTMERREIHVKTAFNGPGGRDAVEYVTRAYTGGRAQHDPSLGTPNLFDELPGPYIWYFTYRDRTVRVRITEGWVKPEFAAMGKKTDRTPEEEQRLIYLRQEMADRLLAAAPADVYQAELV